MSNKNYDDARILLEAENAELQVQPGNPKSLSAILNFLGEYLAIPTYVANKVLALVIALYEQIKIQSTSEYNPVLTQQISEILGKTTSVFVFHAKEFVFNYSGKTLTISDFVVKHFKIKQISAVAVVQGAFYKNNKILETILDPLNFIMIILMCKFINRIKEKYGWADAIPNKYLRAIADILIGQIVALAMNIPANILLKHVALKTAIKDLKESGLINDFVSAYKVYQKFSMDVKVSKLGKIILKIESWFKNHPSDKEVLKQVIEDPEKIDLILSVTKRMF